MQCTRSDPEQVSHHFPTTYAASGRADLSTWTKQPTCQRCGQTSEALPLGQADAPTNTWRSCWTTKLFKDLLLIASDAVAQADIPTDVAEALMSARMVALLKPDGGFRRKAGRAYLRARLCPPVSVRSIDARCHAPDLTT